MRKKLKALVAMMSLCAVGAVGAAYAAWARNSTSGTGEVGNYDQAIYLYWDSGKQTSAGVSDITSLSGGSTVYQYLEVSPKSTKTVEGTVTLSFVLAESAGCDLTGLAVKVYKVNEFPAVRSDETAANAIKDLTANPSLSPSSKSGSTTFDVEKLETPAAHESNAYYIIAVSYAGGATKLGGTVTITQSFTPKAA